MPYEHKVCTATCIYSMKMEVHYNIIIVLVCTCGNSTGSLLLPPPLFSKPVAPLPPPQTHHCSQHKTP